MAISATLAAVEEECTAARAALDAMINTDFLPLKPPELLTLARSFEKVARLVFTAQVQIAGQIDQQNIAKEFGASSTTALLRQTLLITTQDAKTRVNTGKAVHLRQAVSGGTIEPTLPLLAAALTGGQLGIDQTRTTVATMRKLPNTLDPDFRDSIEDALVEHGTLSEPHPFAAFARDIINACDPDGTLDERPDPDKVELHIGTRRSTGLTPFRGLLDDEGVELLHQSIQGLSKPRIETDGTPDRRTAGVRQGQALKEVLRMFLDHGDAPTHGGERPHITITMRYDDLLTKVGAAVLAYGGPISAGEARRIACDAQLIPAVLGGDSEVLDVGRAQRLYPPGIRKGLTLRDKGCAFPGCDRPPGWTDAHHVIPWYQDGHTSHRNGCLLCRYHHTTIHKGDWEIRFAADGIPEFIPPAWIDPDRKPRRNTTNHLSTLLGPVE